MLKDFDITQISKETKVVVLKIQFSEITDTEMYDNIMGHLKEIKDKLEDIGILMLVTDKSVDLQPLTDELLSCGNLKTLD